MACATNKIPGLALGLIRNNEIVYAHGFGVKVVETGEPVTERTARRFEVKRFEVKNT